MLQSAPLSSRLPHLSSSHVFSAGTVRMERRTEETRASAAAIQSGDSPSDPGLPNLQLRPVWPEHDQKGTTACSWPQAWRTGWSRSGTCWQVCFLLYRTMFFWCFQMCLLQLVNSLTPSVRRRCVWSAWPRRRGEEPGLPPERDAHAGVFFSGQDAEDLGSGTERCVFKTTDIFSPSYEKTSPKWLQIILTATATMLTSHTLQTTRCLLQSRKQAHWSQGKMFMFRMDSIVEHYHWSCSYPLTVDISG